MSAFQPQPQFQQLTSTSRSTNSQVTRTQTETRALVKKSHRYPRVAVLLGVPKKWFVPLILCRSLSVLFVVWWGGVTGWNCWLVMGGGRGGGEGGWVSGDGDGQQRDERFRVRLVLVQLGLAYLWAFTAAYLTHLFAASLMSRWLLHYSPPAVVLRLCSLNILLSYGLSQLFIVTGTMTLDPTLSTCHNLENMSASLLVWVVVSVVLLLGYFLTQQDISVESDKDDRRRRLVLRFKCLVALAETSTVSLLALLAVVRLGDSDVVIDWDGLVLKVREVLSVSVSVLKKTRGAGL